MTLKFEIPFPAKFTNEQITEIEDDINARIQIFNQKTGTNFELDNYLVKIRVVMKEVTQK